MSFGSSNTTPLWSLVFPLGMYALASLRLSLASEFAPLRTVAEAMVWIALAAWAITAASFVIASWHSFASHEAVPQPPPVGL